MAVQVVVRMSVRVSVIVRMGMSLRIVMIMMPAAAGAGRIRLLRSRCGSVPATAGGCLLFRLRGGMSVAARRALARRAGRMIVIAVSHRYPPYTPPRYPTLAIYTP